jgi:hypothetical protein
MAKRYYRKMALTAKIETVYGTNSAPSGAANAVLATEVTITPLAGEEVSRDLLLPHLGQQGVVLVGTHAQIEFSVELAGSGDAGTAPAYGPLLRACGLAETVTADTMVEYDPVSGGFESVSIHYNSDGVNHILLGARGTLSFSLTPKQIPRIRFVFTGLLGTITDAALPAVTMTGFQVPLPVNKANTTLSLHGLAAITETVSIDLANSVEPRFLIGSESIEQTNRQTSGSVVVEATTLAVKDWFAIALARTRGALAVQHGTAAGHIIEIDAALVEVGRPTEGQTQDIRNYTLPLMICPSDAGDDEIKFTFR